MRTQYMFLDIAFRAICVVIVLQMVLIVYAHGNMLHLPFYLYAMGIATMALLLVGLSVVNIVKLNSYAGRKDAEYGDGMEGDAQNLGVRAQGDDRPG